MDLTDKRISTQALFALKEALSAVFWTKKDLRKFIELTIENSLILSTIDWTENTKFESVTQLVDRMAKRQDLYQDDLLKLIHETSNFNDFSHLNYWDDSEIKIKKAKEAVIRLRNQSIRFFDKIQEQKKSEAAKKDTLSKIKDTVSYQKKLDDLKTGFLEIALNENTQTRGYQFEKFLNELFNFFDLDPKGPFKIIGEQIDGSFTFDNTDYLLEAKWQKIPINAQTLYGFGGKIQGKLKNTLGLLISLEGFSSECTKTENPSVKSIILMNGPDLMQVLDGRIRLTDMLYIKRRHASQTGEIYYQITT